MLTEDLKSQINYMITESIDLELTINCAQFLSNGVRLQMSQMPKIPENFRSVGVRFAWFDFQPGELEFGLSVERP